MIQKTWRAGAVNAKGEPAFLLDNDSGTKEDAEHYAKIYSMGSDLWYGAVEITYTWPKAAEKVIKKEEKQQELDLG